VYFFNLLKVVDCFCTKAYRVTIHSAQDSMRIFQFLSFFTQSYGVTISLNRLEKTIQNNGRSIGFNEKIEI